MQLRQPKQHLKKPELTLLIFVVSLLLLAVMGKGAVAQTIPGSPTDLWREPVLPRGLGIIANSSNSDSPSGYHSSCCRLFRMPTPIPSDPIGLDTDDPVPGDAAVPGTSSDKDDNRIKLAVGRTTPSLIFADRGTRAASASTDCIRRCCSSIIRSPASAWDFRR